MDKEKAKKAYEAAVGLLREPYGQWIQEVEASQIAACEKDAFEGTEGTEIELQILASDQGRVADRTEAVFRAYFRQHPEVALAYANEDIELSPDQPLGSFSQEVLRQVGIDVDDMDKNASGRVAPWMKPDYSPDTLLSLNYFGDIVCLNLPVVRSAGLEIPGEDAGEREKYDFFLKLSEKAPVGHVRQVLFHRQGMPVNMIPSGAGAEYVDLKEDALRRRGLKGQVRVDHYGYTHVVYEPEQYPRLSVIIPSKDNPALVDTVMNGLRNFSRYPDLELILVDNGSSPEHCLEIEKLRDKYDFLYLYEPMDFNFSTMCNLGAKRSSGELLLFLNDDIEMRPGVTDPDWLKIMAGQVLLPHMGSVGAKLIYPEPNLGMLQHDGMQNIVRGPIHRLQGFFDSDAYYYGHNRTEYDHIGVTAACLMIRREVFEQVGKFREQLRVAYNDVDLCFRICEQGYMQLVRNDVTLLHHESLSRGKDSGGEKLKRLIGERKVLYDMHPEYSPRKLALDPLAVIDPFAPGTEFWKVNSLFKVCSAREYEQVECLSQVSLISDPRRLAFLRKPHDRAWNRAKVMCCIDRKGCCEGQIIVEGWGLVTRRDNACLEPLVLLENERGGMYLASVYPMYRWDVAERIVGQTNVLLSGFLMRLPRESMPDGAYRIGTILIPRRTEGDPRQVEEGLIDPFPGRCFVGFTDQVLYLGDGEEEIM